MRWLIQSFVQHGSPSYGSAELDPTVFSDTQLISFSLDSGAPRPRFREEDDEWLHRRAAESIDYYHLDEATWNAKRHDLMNDVTVLCQKIEQLSNEHPRDDVAYYESIDELAGQ